MINWWSQLQCTVLLLCSTTCFLFTWNKNLKISNSCIFLWKDSNDKPSASRSLSCLSSIGQTTKELPSPPPSTTARFYLLPKIQKPGNPGRPIVASNGAPTENISRFTDFFLWPSVTHFPSLIWYSTNFINKLRRLPQLPPGCLLVALDVSLLYTNSSHEEGITACEEVLNHREEQEPPTTDLCQLICLMLTKNSFVFNETN